jgi:cytochrome b561
VQLRNTAERFGAVAQSLHWVIVAGVVAAYFLAEAGEDRDSAELMDLHRSIGLTILLLAVLRLAWRFLDRRPDWPAAMPGWQRGAARAAHAGFYALLFALPLTGWLVSSLEGDSITWFGWFELPPLTLAVEEDAVEDVHELLFNVLLALAALHVAGALKHQLLDRDGVLRSMLPGKRGTLP